MTSDVVGSLLELGCFPPISDGLAVDHPNFFASMNVSSDADFASILADSFREAFCGSSVSPHGERWWPVTGHPAIALALIAGGP